eukprot:763930-Hanusia_phi.AAC.9
MEKTGESWNSVAVSGWKDAEDTRRSEGERIGKSLHICREFRETYSKKRGKGTKARCKRGDLGQGEEEEESRGGRRGEKPMAGADGNEGEGEERMREWGDADIF